ncbi:MAG: hypothetical protein IPP91_17310 [Betaproteobacteria bacterium]|nr:hypothetical protein [Betaproteobacteria bacterium]
MTAFDSEFYNRYEELSRVRLSPNFLLRDFLFSVEAAVAGHSNFPTDDSEHVIKSGRLLCEKLLEPLLDHFGRFAITFGYQNRETIERRWTPEERLAKGHSSSPHQWDRGGPFPGEVYARVDILPFCVEDGLVSKLEFGQWIMFNLDIDLLMQWQRSNVCCMTIGPLPRRVWVEWVPAGEGPAGGNKIEHMGETFWNERFPSMPEAERPKCYPSATDGSMRFGKYFLERDS